MADDESLLDTVHGLSDLELAVLLCLINREHGLISTPQDAIDDLVLELQLIATKTFGLGYAFVDCTPATTLDDFATALLVPDQANDKDATSPQTRQRSGSYFISQPSLSHQHTQLTLDDRVTSADIANVVVAKNLDRAPKPVQIQALELLRTRRIFTRTSVQTAPKQFVFIPVLEATSGGEAHVTPHLNDFFCIAHWHDPEDGFVNLEEGSVSDDAETASTSSVVKRSFIAATPSTESAPLISESDISRLATLAQDVQVDIEVLRYQMNIVSFLRMHRAVEKGISPAATKHLDKLVRCLATLHNMDFVTPAIVGLAAKKVYMHRIYITTPENERSMQWGSSLDAVKTLLDGVGPEEVIEDVLEMVTAPL